MESNTIQELRNKYREASDGAGLEIDEGIFEAIVYLNALGFHTEQSCEGHIERALPYAWIQFIGPTAKAELEKSEKNASLYWEIHHQALNSADKVVDSVNNFNKWMKIYRQSISQHPNFEEFAITQGQMATEAHTVYQDIQKLLKSFINKYPQHKNLLDLEFIDESVRLNFTDSATVQLSMEHTISQDHRTSIKETSDSILDDFHKYLMNI